MELLNFKGTSLWITSAVFTVAAVVVWAAGTRISGYASAISDRTGLGKAFIGLLLLGGITSLPEVAVTATASYGGDAALAVNNLLGGLAMQVAILAVADAAIGRDALTSVVVKPGVLLQGALDVLALSAVAVAILVGEVAVFGIGGWASLILGLCLFSIWRVARYRHHPGWTARGSDGRPPRPGDARRRSEEPDAGPLKTVFLKTVAAAIFILIAGFLLARTGEGIAHQTGLGSSFVGAVFVAISTSLPEVSTVLAAMRLRQYEMAISDIFGTNLFDVGLIFLVDAIYRGGPVLNEVGRFSAVAALLGIVVTTLYIAGLVERRDRTFLRMGIDSLAVLVAYLGGLAILYQLR